MMWATYGVIFVFVTQFFIQCVNGEEFFKVPLEVREKNRPKRLVDDVNDPDMKKLKNLQDKFFSIIGNSSLGREFKSFNQLVHLVDSDAGLELGRILVNGFMISFGKEQSNQLLTEFLDDFQYRIPPELADALVDYKDFMKTFDLKMIPPTIEMLFRKNQLGNSLAQMPMGQLVDLIQPEASKYGIDVRSFINGIIGKGDSTFPELVRKLMHNFNISSLMNTVTKSLSEVGENNPDQKHISGETKKNRKNQSLMLFKPLVAKLLKENDIDLEAEAVIQVLTPFINAGGQYLQGMMPSSQGNGKEFDFAQLMPLLGLLSTQTMGKNKNSKDSGANIMEAVMSVVGGMGKNNQNMDLIMNLASQFLNSKNTGKKSKSHDEKESNVDMESILQLAQTIAGNSKGGAGLEGLAGLANQMNKDSNVDMGKIMQMASNLIDGIGKTKTDTANQLTKNEKTKPVKKKRMFPEALEQFLLRIQTDKKCHTKIKDAMSLGKALLYSKFENLEEFKNQLATLLRPYKTDIDKDIEALFIPLSYSEDEWREFWKGMSDRDFRHKLVKNTVKPATEIVALLSSDEFQKRQNAFLALKSSDMFASFGIKGVTLNNFPERLGPLLNMASRGWDLPVNIASLLDPLKNSLKSTWPWYTENMDALKYLSSNELERVVAQSLKHDLANPLLAIWRISEASKSSSNCIPKAVCDLVRDITPDKPLRLLIARIASIIYGGVRAVREDNFLIITQVARAAVFEGNCEKYFPIQCPQEYSFSDEPEEAEDELDDEDEDITIHQEL